MNSSIALPTALCLGFLAAGCLLLACQDDDPLARSRLAGLLGELSSEAGQYFEVSPAGTPEVNKTFAHMLGQASIALHEEADLPVVDVLNQILFDDMRFEREVNLVDLDNILLPGVIHQRRGSCVGLAGVYLVLAELLEQPIRGVLVPGHFFLRYESGNESVNIELLRSGERMSDEWYLQKYKPPRSRRAYMRPLSTREVAAVFRYNLANAYRRRGWYNQAMKHYQRVLHQLPGFAEAYANLGLVHQLLGEPFQAERAYLDALKAHPGLPGLNCNLAHLYRKLNRPDEMNKYRLQAEQDGQPCSGL